MKSGLMKYNGYRASIAYDDTDNIFIGEVLGITDSLNFHGTSISELEQSFHDCIENYLDYCAQIGKDPQKEYSGNFNVRTSPSVHARASEYAAENGISLNQVVTLAIEKYLGIHHKNTSRR